MQQICIYRLWIDSESNSESIHNMSNIFIFFLSSLKDGLKFIVANNQCRNFYLALEIIKMFENRSTIKCNYLNIIKCSIVKFCYEGYGGNFKWEFLRREFNEKRNEEYINNFLNKDRIKSSIFGAVFILKFYFHC